MMSKDDSGQFELECRNEIAKMIEDKSLNASAHDFFLKAQEHKYSYHFKWMGVPIIQYPQDIVAMQELIWQIQPDIIVETGIARGGSIVFYASMLSLLGQDRCVVGIDIDIRAHNKKVIDDHPMCHLIELIEASSTDPETVKQVKRICEGKRVLVVLDSNHTHEHVLAELNAYESLVAKGSYIVVMDTVIEDLPDNAFPNRSWGVGDSPKSAVKEFLKDNKRFEIDVEHHGKLLLSVAPSGYLRCLEDQ